MLKQVKHINVKKQTSIYKNLSLLIFKSFTKDSRNIIFMIFVPFFFSVMFFFIFDKQGLYLLKYSLLPCATILTALTPQLVEWKNSVFLKRIDITGVKKSLFLICLWTVFLLSGMIGFVIVFLANFLVSLAVLGNGEANGFIQSFHHIRIGYFILSVILICIISIALSTFIGGIFNQSGAAQGITMMIYFFSIFLSGMMLPTFALYSSKTTVYLSYFIPHKYPMFIYLYSLSEHSWLEFFIDPSFNQATQVTFQGLEGSHSFTSTWQPIIGSLGIIAGFFILSSFTFKWSAKR